MKGRGWLQEIGGIKNDVTGGIGSKRTLETDTWQGDRMREWLFRQA